VIFIIDDDKYVLRGYQFLLRSARLESAVFEGVEEFLQSWTPAGSDILIIDIHMPGLNGVDLLNYLEDNKIHVPVIVITAYDEEESREASEKYGAVAYLTKPVDGESLLRLISGQPDKQPEFKNY
jgi:FixJ family two-component response regulator